MATLALTGSTAPASADLVQLKNKQQTVPKLEEAFGLSGGLDPNINLTDLARNGVAYFRTDASWVGGEPKPPTNGEHHYEWESYDDIATRLALGGMRWYPILDYTPAWASTTPSLFSMPSNPNDFAAYGQAFARRYGPGGEFWDSHPEIPYLPIKTYEIWNEPNNPDFLTNGTPASFYQMYALSRNAIRAVQPDAKVVLGGMLHSGSLDAVNNWFVPLAKSVNKPLAQAVDAVAYHPYQGYPSTILSGIKQLRLAMDKHGGENVPIEITEFDGYAGVTPTATWVKTLQMVTSLANSDCKVTRVMPFQANGDTANEISQDGWFTLHNNSGRLTPVGYGYLQGVARTRQKAQKGQSYQYCYPVRKKYRNKHRRP